MLQTCPLTEVQSTYWHQAISEKGSGEMALGHSSFDT